MQWTFMSHMPEFLHHSHSLKRNEAHNQQFKDKAGWDDAGRTAAGRSLWHVTQAPSSPVIDLMLKGTEILLSHGEMMCFRGLCSNCHSGWRCGTVTVCNDEFVTAVGRGCVWVISERGQPGQLTAGAYQESGTPQGADAESAESFPHLGKVELPSVVMTQPASSGVRCPDVSYRKKSFFV